MIKPGDWKLYTGGRKPHGRIDELPLPPKWRPMRASDAEVQPRVLPDPENPRTWPTGSSRARGENFDATESIVQIVNAALYLRRPLLVTGKPGSGKSSLVEAVAFELCLGQPLRWPVTSRSTLREALYQYDAIGRLQDEKSSDPNHSDDSASDPRAPHTALAQRIGRYIRLGSLGTALLPSSRPRALLIDEIDKADIDLPNDLLNVFEEGEFEIPELSRLKTDEPVEVMTADRQGQPTAQVTRGQVRCRQFPFVVLTSNGEREFPAPFLRRCLRLEMPNPTGNRAQDYNAEGKRLRRIVELHFSKAEIKRAAKVIDDFVERVKSGSEQLATDQLLNAVYFAVERHVKPDEERKAVLEAMQQELVARR
ncbi:MAG TPA: MoxR family ATPase [Candidatus Margulisiibacteriota bacterium]|nr:MoxR family ATPase [Candidatus Margulisiibacteriota bacterium]